MTNPTVVVAAFGTMETAGPGRPRRSKRGSPPLGTNDRKRFNYVLKSIQWNGTKKTEPAEGNGIKVEGDGDNVTLSVHLSDLKNKLYNSEFTELAAALANSTRVDALYLQTLSHMNNESLQAIMQALVENENAAIKRGGHSAIEHLNIGETPGVSGEEWGMFAAMIPGTNLKSVYTSESGNAPQDVRAQISENLLENRAKKGKPRRKAHHIPPPGSIRQRSANFTDAGQSSVIGAKAAGSKRPAAGPASTLSLKTPRSDGLDDSDSAVVVEDEIDEDKGNKPRISTDFRLVNKVLGLKEPGSGIEEKVYDIQIPHDSKLWIKRFVKPGTSKEVTENYSPETYVLCANPDDHSLWATGICRDKPGGGIEKWLEIRPSGILGSGMGLFVSKVPIEGTDGIAFRAGDLIVPYSDRYFIRSSLTEEQENYIKRTNDYILEEKWFRPPKSDLPQNPRRSADDAPGVLFNGKHSIGGKVQQAMSTKAVNCLFGEIEDMGRIPFVQATRDIKTGEELFVDYGWDDDLQIQRFGKIAIATKDRKNIDYPDKGVLGKREAWKGQPSDSEDEDWSPRMR